MNQICKVFRSVQMINASKNVLTRNFVGVCSLRRDFDVVSPPSLLKTFNPSFNAVAKAHSKGERELVEFLSEEIASEKKAQKVQKLPTEVEGFAVSFDGSEVELKKDVGSDKVIIKFNINHTVDAEEPEGTAGQEQEDEFAEMKSKPNFEVDIVRQKSTLSFTCSFLQGEAQEGEYNDVFGIDEITIYEGEHSEKNYAVAGDVLDGYLYDLLMNFLEEKGISNSFAEKLSEFSTAYEHQNYIRFLDELSKFTVNTK